jgi:hypothetical protein
VKKNAREIVGTGRDMAIDVKKGFMGNSFR